MSVMHNPSSEDPRVFAAAQKVLASTHKSNIAEGFSVEDQIYDSEILAIGQSILEEAGL